jgi:hypothetical protein
MGSHLRHPIWFFPLSNFSPPPLFPILKSFSFYQDFQEREDRLARQEAGNDASGQVGQAGHLWGLVRTYVKTGRTGWPDRRLGLMPTDRWDRQEICEDWAGLMWRQAGQAGQTGGGDWCQRTGGTGRTFVRIGMKTGRTGKNLFRKLGETGHL